MVVSVWGWAFCAVEERVALYPLGYLRRWARFKGVNGTVEKALRIIDFAIVFNYCLSFI